jgi:hypothetical protein
MKKTRLVIAALLVLSVVQAFPASAAGDFTPVMEFELSDTKVKANPEMKIHVEQDAEEEELAHVTLKLPKGFNLPADEDIPGDTELGSGEITIAAGPGCHPTAGAIPVAVDANLPATLLETDRSDEQADRGVYAVWTLDITGVTEIVLEITGSKAAGWTLDGDIPGNDGTCPPLVFDMSVNSEADGTPILTNAKKPKTYIFSGAFTSAESPTILTIKQPIKLTK